MDRKRSLLIFFSFALMWLALDQWTKSLVLSKFQLGETYPLIEGFFHLTYVQNTGVAFGMLQAVPDHIRIPILTIIPVLASIFIVIYFIKLNDRHWLNTFGFSLIFSGAIGNFIDRAKYQFVIDMLDFHWKDVWHYPVFNVADSGITVGVGLILLRSWLTRHHQA